jgi:hypothetical protein
MGSDGKLETVAQAILMVGLKKAIIYFILIIPEILITNILIESHYPKQYWQLPFHLPYT